MDTRVDGWILGSRHNGLWLAHCAGEAIAQLFYQLSEAEFRNFKIPGQNSHTCRVMRHDRENQGIRVHIPSLSCVFCVFHLSKNNSLGLLGCCSLVHPFERVTPFSLLHHMVPWFWHMGSLSTSWTHSFLWDLLPGTDVIGLPTLSFLKVLPACPKSLLSESSTLSIPVTGPAS